MVGKVREKLFEGTIQHVELNPSDISAHYGNNGLLSAAAILKSVLSDFPSSDQELASFALRSLAYCLRDEKFVAEISDEDASAVLSSICQLIMSTDKKVLCSLAVRCLGIQAFRPQVVEACLDLILQAVLYVADSSKALTYEALQVFVKLAQNYLIARIKSSLWAPAIYRRLLSPDKKDREAAEQCMKDLEFMLLLPSQLSLSAVVAADISGTLLHKLEKMVKSKASVLPAVRAWGWFVRLLGSLAGEKRTLVNQMLKIVEVTFTNQDALVRNASLVAWEALIDVLLQLPNVSGQQIPNINAGVSLSSGELVKPLLVPPLKRLKLLMVPLVSIMNADKEQVVRLACWRTWQYLAHKLGTAINHPSVVDVVVFPIFEAMFRFGPDTNYPSAWDLCLKALEDWICCKFQNKIDFCLSRARSISIPGKAPSPETPTCNGVEMEAEMSFTILWAPWSLQMLDVFLKLGKLLWSFGLEWLQSSCDRNLSLSGALRIFLLLVKGVEGDGKGAIKPSKQHIDSVHSLLMFLNVSFQHVPTASMKEEVLLAVDSLIESFLDLQHLVLSSSFYKLPLAPMNSQRKLGEPSSTFHKCDTDSKEQDGIELSSADSVTPIVYLVHSWILIASATDLSKPERETFMKRLESLVLLAIRGFNVMGNLSGLASVLDLCLSESGRRMRVDEADERLARHDNNVESGAFCVVPHGCVHLLMSWKVIAEHTAKYLEDANDIFSVEGVVGDSGYQVIFRILLFPLQVYLQLSSLASGGIKKANPEVKSGEFISAISGVDIQVVKVLWLKLFEWASHISSRISLQANLFASGLSQKILKLLEKELQQQSTSDGNHSFAEMLTFVAINVLKRTKPSNFAMLALNRKRRYGSFLGTLSTSNGVGGSEAEGTSNVRNILALASRVLDLSCDKCTAGEEYWLDPTARVLEELATFAARLNSQHDLLMFVQEFSKPYAKWLKFSESVHDSKNNDSSIRLTESLQKAWQEHLRSLQKCHPSLSFNSNLLSLQALALASAFQHSRKSISSCTVSFWEATYGSKATALNYPPCLGPVLEKVKSKVGVSLPGWNRGRIDLTRRKSDVACYTLTGRRCLQVFQEHLVNAQKASPGMLLPLPKVAMGGEDTSSQAVASSPLRSGGDSNSKDTDMMVNAVPKKSMKLPGLSGSGHTSIEANQVSLQLAKSSIPSKIAYSPREVDNTCGALPTENGLITFMSAAAPKRKNLRFLDSKTFAYASNPVSEEGLFFGQLEGDMVKGVLAGSGNVPSNGNRGSTPSTEGLICSSKISQDVGDSDTPGDSDTGVMNLKIPGRRYVCEMKKLGARQQRFLRSSGSLRGGKFWRDTSGTVKALQKIRKRAATFPTAENVNTEGSVDSADSKTCRRVGEPSLAKGKEAEATLYAVNEAHTEQLPRRGRSRSLGFVNNGAPYDAIQSSKELDCVANAEDADQPIQTVFEKDANLGTSKGEKLAKKAFPESPFRVQTLNRGLYGKIFSSVVRQSNAANSFASRSHHRKNSCPRRIPMLKDEQNGVLHDLHSTPKAKLRRKAREADCQSGFEFTTPSKILRSGKKLKAKKWGGLSAANKVEEQGLENPLQKATLFEYSKDFSHSRATDWCRADVGEPMLAEPDLLALRSLEVGELPGKVLDLRGSLMARNHGQTSASLENDGRIRASPSWNVAQSNGELVDPRSRHRLCDLLADLSTSAEWNTMSLDDLEHAHKFLGRLQGLVHESKRRMLNDQAAKV